MSEIGGLWQTMRVAMGRGHHWRQATRHEEALQAGIADVSYVSANGHHGWIELKHLKEWPRRESTIVRLDHYTNDQKNFLKAKGRAGSYTWLFLQVGRDYLLFDWRAAQKVGELNKEALEEIAFGVWHNGCDWQSLGYCLGIEK